MEKFSVGDIAVSKYLTEFRDGTSHQPGQQIKVTEVNVYYFNTCHDEYDQLGQHQCVTTQTAYPE